MTKMQSNLACPTLRLRDRSVRLFVLQGSYARGGIFELIGIQVDWREQNLFLNRMEISWRALTNRLLKNYAHIAHHKDRFPHMNYLLYFLQFIQLSLFKFAAADHLLNADLGRLGDWAKSIMVNPLSFLLLNLLLLLLVGAFAVMLVLKQKLNQQNFQSSKKQRHKQEVLISIVYLYAIIQLMTLPCYSLNVEYYCDFIINGLAMPSVFVVGVSTLNTCLIVLSALVYSEGMLLGKWIFALAFLSLQVGIFTIPMKLISVLVLFALSLKKPPFERILIRLLLFYFSMDFIAFMTSFTIGLMHFLTFNILIVLGEFLRPTESQLNSVESQNSILIESLQKLSKRQTLQKKEEITLLTIIFKNKDKIQQFTSYLSSPACKDPKEFFLKVNVRSLEWLCLFFRLKMDVNLKQSPNSLIIKLQQAIFSLKYEKISVALLVNIIKLNDQNLETKTFKDYKLLTEIELLLNQLNSKQSEYKNAKQFIAFSQKIQLYNQFIFECCEGMIQFFTRLKAKHLNQQNLLNILSNVCKNEEQFVQYIKEIQIYKGTSTEIRLYDYAMKLLNFDYEPKMMRKGEIQCSHSLLVNSHYIYITQNKITDVSNRVLKELKLKREQVIDENFDILIPRQLKYCLQSKFEKVFQADKTSPEFILPFIQMRESLLPYKIKVDIKFDINAGIKYVIHFLKSQEMQQSPAFLYSLDNDQIVNSCPLFRQYFKLHKRRLDENNLGTDIFGVDMSHSIKNCEKTDIDCVLKRQKTWQHNIPIKLFVLQTYKLKNGQYALIQLLTKEIQQQNSQVKFKSLDKLVTKDFFLEEEMEMRSRSQTKHQIYFCRIKHPCEDMIYVQMSRLKSSYRKSYIKWILMFLILICVVLAAGIVQICYQVGSNNINYQHAHDLFLSKEKQTQSIYSLFYQYYQYYQIFNYPGQFLQIQPYNISALVSEYQKKSNDNILYLSQSFSNTFILDNNTYKLYYDNYNKTMITGPLSLVQFLTDLKQSLISNNPSFSVRNAGVIATITNSFQTITLQNLYDATQYIQYLILAVNCAIFVCLIMIKLIDVKLQLAYRQVFKIYDLIQENQIDRCLQKYKQLVYLGKNSITYKFESKKWKDWKSIQQNKIAASLKKQIKQEQFAKDKNPNQHKIRYSPNSIILINRAFLIVIPIVCCFFFLLFDLDLKAYKTNADLIFKKTSHIQKSILFLLQKSQSYFQLAMQQILPEDQRQKVQRVQSKYLYTNFFSPLPPFFDQYLVSQRQVFTANLCNYSYLNTGSLYKGINCSLVLNDVMDASFSSTFILFQQLIQAFKGTYISQLGNTFARNSVYPVFMEICYVRRTLNNMLNNLQTMFTSSVVQFIKQENDRLLGEIFKGICLFPLVIGLAGYTARKLAYEARAIIKCIKILPKKAILNFKIAKFIRKENIFQKASMIPF